MRKILLFCLTTLGFYSFSQSPQLLNYQGIARNSSGTTITGGSVGLKFEIIQGSPSGAVVYKEENSSSPSSSGVFTTAIGSGSANVGSFSTINWASGPYFIRVGVDPTGGTAFTTVGTSQLLSVPYALYAETAGNLPSFTAGSGITINSGTITNSAPNQTVNITGTSVVGTYPSYTITNPGAPTAGTGISIVSGTITNTAPDQTVTISGATGTYPNFTITPAASTSITAGNSNISVSGSDPNFTISSVPSLSVVGNQLSISNGNTVTLPTGTTYTNGAGIAFTSGTVITNTAPDQTVTIANGTNVNVTGVYPNFVVNSTPSLSIAANVISISGGNSIALPPPATLTPSTGISIVGGTITNTAPNQTVSITGLGSASVTGVYPNFNINTPLLPPPPVIIGQGTATVTTVGNNYTVTTPATSLTLNGVNNNILSAGTNSVTIATYTAGSGLLMSGAFPNFSLSTTSTGTNAGWSTLGNAGTVDGTNFIGTTDNIPFNIRVNNQKAGRIDQLLINSFFGYQAGNSNTSGPRNTAYGNQALYSNTTGNDNSATGYQALYSNIVGGGNVAIGNYALYSNTGSNNVATGPNALYSNTSGGTNIAYGNSAGYSNSTGSGNVFLGNTAGYYELGSNKLYIANNNVNPPLIYGDFTTGNVGLNTISPTAKLHLTGSNTTTLVNAFSASPQTAIRINNDDLTNNNFSSLIFSTMASNLSNFEAAKIVGVNSNHTAGSIGGDLVFMTRDPGNINERMRITSAGYVGIGTNTPASPLTVSSPTPTYIRVESTGSTTQNGIIFKNPTREWDIINFVSTSDRISFYDATASQERFSIDGPTGNVGIGNTAPGNRLSVLSPGSDIAEFKSSSASDNRILISGPSGIWGSAGYAQFNNTFQFSSYGNTDLCFGTNNLSSVNMYLKTSGFVGIGTSAPSSLLHVNGPVTITDGTQGAGKVLTSNAAGNASWQNPPPKIGFNAGTNPVANQSIPANAVTTVQFGAGINFFNDGGGYNTGTFAFTPPSAGVYEISCHLSITGSAGATLQVFINTPGGWVARCAGSIPSSGSTIVTLNATVNSSITGGPYNVQVFSNNAMQVLSYDSSFTGHKVY